MVRDPTVQNKGYYSNMKRLTSKILNKKKKKNYTKRNN